MRNKIVWFVFLFYFASGVVLFSGDDAIIIKNPAPTHKENKFTPLVMVKEISEEIDDKTFMAMPKDLAVNNKGEIFVFDIMLRKIFKFDNQYRFVKTFGGPGQGPAEFGDDQSRRKKLYFAHNNHLYVNDSWNRRLIVFDSEGNALRHIRIPMNNYALSIHPVVDELENFYFFSKNNGGIDVFDKEFNLHYTLLEKKHYNRFIFYKVYYRPKGPIQYDVTLIPNSGNTDFDVLPGNRTLIYLENGSTVFLFKGKHLVKQYDVWPEGMLRHQKKLLKKYEENLKRSVFPLVMNMFLDYDDFRYFYLLASGLPHLYKFNLDGELIEVLSIDFWSKFMAKRNGLFYGIRTTSEKSFIRIYKIMNRSE